MAATLQLFSKFGIGCHGPVSRLANMKYIKREREEKLGGGKGTGKGEGSGRGGKRESCPTTREIYADPDVIYPFAKQIFKNATRF